MEELFIGIDLGTQGVRALAVSAAGRVVAASQAGLEAAVVRDAGKIHEQDPGIWWETVCRVTRELVAKLKRDGTGAQALRGLAVDGTSGTLVCVDPQGNALRPAIMYNDARTQAEAERLNETAASFCQRLGYRFGSSFALPRILWVQAREPGIFRRTARFLHQADYVQGCLTGDFHRSDYSNALKTGYDLLEDEWPAWMDSFPGLRERLPQVTAPGAAAGRVCVTAAEQTGLPRGLPVVAGATDGTAASLASGLRRPGEYNTTLGTTLVFKQLSDRLARHPQGLVYSHKLPGGRWLPGAASNTGGEWIERRFPGADLQRMDQAAAVRLPASTVAYPLVREGERFPFLAPAARGFCIPEAGEGQERYAAFLQGTALVERMGYEVIDRVTGHAGGDVYSTGGGSRSDLWMQCRADVTGRRLHRPQSPESAFGSALLAAAGTHYASLWEAVERMVRMERTFEPDARHARRYDEVYGRFREEIARRGWS